MNEFPSDDLPGDRANNVPDDPLLALLDSFTVAGSDIENRVMAQLAREEEAPITIQAEVADLRAEVVTMRAEIAELKRILLSGRDASLNLTTPDLRGRTLLPYARPDKALPILS